MVIVSSNFLEPQLPFKSHQGWLKETFDMCDFGQTWSLTFCSSQPKEKKKIGRKKRAAITLNILF